MKTLHTEIEITASAERVWDTLADLKAYPTWNPFITRVAGELMPGAKLEVRLEPPDASPMTFRPAVLTVKTGRELRWIGRVVVPGLFDGEHHFEIQPLGPGRVRFVQEERFTGVLVPVFARGLDDNTRRGFEAMNAALKARAEAAALSAPALVGHDNVL
jgi:hypothetical protein